MFTVIDVDASDVKAGDFIIDQLSLSKRRVRFDQVVSVGHINRFTIDIVVKSALVCIDGKHWANDENEADKLSLDESVKVIR